MKAKNVRQVFDYWRRGIRAHAGSASTDGKDVFSYNLKIGFTKEDGTKVALNYRSPNNFKTMTTSKHVGYAAGEADETIEPTK
jgi:hypothetical protein